MLFTSSLLYRSSLPHISRYEHCSQYSLSSSLGKNPSASAVNGFDRHFDPFHFQDRGPPNTLYYIVRDVVKIRPGYRYRIPHIGLAIEKLMGNGFRSSYTSEAFRAKYSSFRNKIKVYKDTVVLIKVWYLPYAHLDFRLCLCDGGNESGRRGCE